MRSELEEEIGKLSSLARERGAEVQRIATHDVVVAEWVRFKCRFGCKGYGKHMSCPPYAPTVAEPNRLLAEYSTALLLRFEGVPGRPNLKPDEIPLDFHPFFRDLILWVNSTIHLLEKTAFYDDFPKAFGFGGYPCIYCEHLHCVAEEHEGVVDESIRRLCWHMDLVRPTMEGAGNDVFSTARKAGWDLHVIPAGTSSTARSSTATSRR